MKITELLQGVEVEKISCDCDMEIDAVCYDSRRVKPGSAFVAARRIGGDGHDYIEYAMEKGASVIISKNEVEGYPHVIVKNGEQALAVMSANMMGNPARNMAIIGVTGTKGKTTTTYMIKSVLEKTTGKKVGLIGTIQNMIGEEILPAKNTTPEAPELHELLRKMNDAGCAYVVMEVSSHSLAIDRVYGVPFEIGVFTNLSQDHLDYHKTMENYFDVKAKLFDMCEWGIINIDDEYGQQLVQRMKCKKYTFSTESDDADLNAKNIRFLDEQGCSFEALIRNEITRVYLQTPGLFTVYNALAAIGACLKLGISLIEIASTLPLTESVRGRVEVIPTNTDYKVIVDYAHSPSSVESVVEAVCDFTPGRVISVLGCGGDRDRSKRPLMAAAAKKSGMIILTTDNPRSERPSDIIDEMLTGFKGISTPHEVIEDRRDAIFHALSIAKAGDTVLIMGKGHETYQEVNGVKNHFDDREEVLAFYTSKQGKRKL